jgi:hypothetical protein
METKFLIQVFPNGLGTTPRLEYRLKKEEFTINEGMVNIQDPKTNLLKRFPTSICIIDEVME